MTPMVMASPVRRIEDTMQRRTSDWTSSIRDDLETVKKRIELDDVEHLRFVDPIIGTSIQRQAYIPSGLMLLTARAFALDASGEEALCAFAAAMELIVMSLGAHAKLPERRALQAAEPMLALGPAIGVLLGDLLYTRAFRLIVQTGVETAVAEVAAVTERMIVAATCERFSASAGAPANAAPTLLAAAYAGCCSIAAVLANAPPSQRRTSENPGRICASLQHRPSTVRVAELTLDVGEGGALITRLFSPSKYRDGVHELLTHLTVHSPEQTPPG